MPIFMLLPRNAQSIPFLPFICPNIHISIDSEDEAVALLLLGCRRHRRERQRALWMHPLTSSTHGQFYTIMSDLRGDSAKFFNYFRIFYDYSHCSVRPISLVGLQFQQ